MREVDQRSEHRIEVRPRPRRAASVRPEVRGKFLFAGGEKLYVRGVTYGPFRPERDGCEYHTPEVVERDFASIAARGMNAVRTYTVPPRWLLDAAQRHGLRVMVGLPWEQHVDFLGDRARVRSIEARVREGVRSCAGHPALLCHAVGNEIPAPSVRWHGRRAVEAFLERLYRAAKAEDPDGLVTYVNYPTTEYLSLPFVDLVCFNVYLESRERLSSYLSRLQNLVDDRPLLMGEVGLDSRSHGELAQARGIEWQVRTAFAAGCAGAFVFSWTDEWHRGGHDIEDWEFGLTTRTRRPKPALMAVRDAFADVPFPSARRWPRISVVVCTYNGARTIRDCLEGVRELEYPDFELIVVDDGSTDGTGELAEACGARVIRTENRGLSSARNLGLEMATGEIVAYLDDDARPDPHWLTYLADTFQSGDYVAVGGPNLVPPEDGRVAQCVANAPGGPVHVLLSDREAEHLPGCNLAIRTAALRAIGGFDPTFRVAGDDVDVCWRLQERGGRLGYSPAAMVWHHRRNSVAAYWKQQRGYGRAEALLEEKWPEKYNTMGHPTWGGRIYGDALARALSWRRGRVHHGTWGSALFQSLYEPAPGTLWSVARMPEWYLVVLGLGALCALGAAWTPLLLALPSFALALSISLVQAVMSAEAARFPSGPGGRRGRLGMRALTAWLHLLQPLARLWGRMLHGLGPWRWRGAGALALPRPRSNWYWSERWRSAEERLHALEGWLRSSGAVVLRGGAFDLWDLEVRGGLLGAIRVRTLVEEHGAGRQLVRFHLRPRISLGAILLFPLFAALALGAAVDGAPVAAGALGAAAMLVALRAVGESASAMGAALHGFRQAGEELP